MIGNPSSLYKSPDPVIIDLEPLLPLNFNNNCTSVLSGKVTKDYNVGHELDMNLTIEYRILPPPPPPTSTPLVPTPSKPTGLSAKSSTLPLIGTDCILLVAQLLGYHHQVLPVKSDQPTYDSNNVIKTATDLMRVCKQWYSIISNSPSWKIELEKVFPIEYDRLKLHNNNLPDKQSWWYEKYIQLNNTCVPKVLNSLQAFNYSRLFKRTCKLKEHKFQFLKFTTKSAKMTEILNQSSLAVSPLRKIQLFNLVLIMALLAHNQLKPLAQLPLVLYRMCHIHRESNNEPILVTSIGDLCAFYLLNNEELDNKKPDQQVVSPDQTKNETSRIVMNTSDALYNALVKRHLPNADTIPKNMCCKYQTCSLSYKMEHAKEAIPFVSE